MEAVEVLEAYFERFWTFLSWAPVQDAYLQIVYGVKRAKVKRCIVHSSNREPDDITVILDALQAIKTRNSRIANYYSDSHDKVSRYICPMKL